MPGINTTSSGPSSRKIMLRVRPRFPQVPNSCSFTLYKKRGTRAFSRGWLRPLLFSLSVQRARMRTLSLPHVPPSKTKELELTRERAKLPPIRVLTKSYWSWESFSVRIQRPWRSVPQAKWAKCMALTLCNSTYWTKRTDSQGSDCKCVRAVYYSNSMMTTGAFSQS